jgi:oligoendopeptidase F
VDELRRQVRELERRGTDPGIDGRAAIGLVDEWNRLLSSIDTSRTRALIAYYRNTKDAWARQEQRFWSDNAATLQEVEAIHARALLEGPRARAIEAAFGPHVFRLKECLLATSTPEMGSILSEEARLVAQYSELASRQEIELNGSTYTISSIKKFFDSSDSARRFGAWKALEGFLERHTSELELLLARLVKVRNRRAAPQ